MPCLWVDTERLAGLLVIENYMGLQPCTRAEGYGWGTTGGGGWWWWRHYRKKPTERERRRGRREEGGRGEKREAGGVWVERGRELWVERERGGAVGGERKGRGCERARKGRGFLALSPLKSKLGNSNKGLS